MSTIPLTKTNEEEWEPTNTRELVKWFSAMLNNSLADVTPEIAHTIKLILWVLPAVLLWCLWIPFVYFMQSRIQFITNVLRKH